MKKTEIYRPIIHFSAEKGWINDPNGLVYENGNYHLFYQHYPNATHWGPMHWGHAVSRDLIHWEHLPMALVPDDLGAIFSGSAIMDTDNVTGFGDGTRPPMVLVYTNHNLTSKKEEQSIAYSTDYIHFTKYEGNPVIKGIPGGNSRDPKVFRNPVRGGFSMALATEDCVSFYASQDLRTWEKTGEFYCGEHGLCGICECPDCFPMETPEGVLWVLIVSMIVPEPGAGEPVMPGNRMSHVTQYYVGTFDGDRFLDTQGSPEPLLLDYGTDSYASVTFNDAPERIMISWADNWDYANESPAGEEGFQGKMTLGRKLSLVETSEGYRLKSEFCGLRETLCSGTELSGREDASAGLPVGQAVGVSVELCAGGSISFANGYGEALKLSADEEELVIDRTGAGRSDFSDRFASERTGVIRIPRKERGALGMEIVLDRCLMELAAEHGLTCASVGVYPRMAYDRILLSGIETARVCAIGGSAGRERES
ncbi:glycoside hydrolase family 32 protein [Lachnoclostridium sp. Marseille-P6806]|uniref:glycoside hydrolase family 32 protein n=1 Tax=Lachnoclostridium sp. Marseille-P6806 TaxID=2364793 RepID=UPI0010309724|nr:glycoside hydrolase family 32 protein [Lachnoclostridium sp. Marseille-P6806]